MEGSMDKKPKERRCKGRTKSGAPCRAAATASGLCFFHGNPDKASELGRIGGRKNRHITNENLDPLPTLNTALAVRETGDRLIRDLHGGKIDPRTASSLALLLRLQLHAIDTADFEPRIKKLEQKSGEILGDATPGNSEDTSKD